MLTLWFDSYNGFQQAIFVIAASTSIILFVMLVLMLFGAHDASYDGDIDAGGFDHDPSVDHIDTINDDPLSSLAGLKLFTLRGTLVFFSIFGWVTLICNQSLGVVLSLLIGIVSGLIAAFLVALAFRQIMKLEDEGNVNYKNAVGKLGTVYIRIPANRTGKGKISIVVQERLVEIDAVTDELEDLKANIEVEVVDLIDSSTLVVKKHK